MNGSGSRSFHTAWGAPAAVAVVVYSLWSVTRHERFGSGSWDLGCHNHNIWLIAHMKGWTSTVLGNVNFMGDHFMPSLVLLAPLGWTGSTSILLYAQALLLAAAALPLALLCRDRRLSPTLTSAVVIGYLFGTGTQAAANFDFHEVALVPLTLLTACWALERKQRALAYSSLVILAGSKEPAILYAGAVGVWLCVSHRGRRLEGLGIAVASVVAFFVVTTVVQPWLLAGGPQGMIHLARFSTFGDTPATVAAGILRQPSTAMALLVTPAEKLTTLLITLGGFGFFPLIAPDALVLSLPNLLERFLSDKREMWGMGFHYSLVLTAVGSFAAAAGAARLRDRMVARSQLMSSATFERLAAVVILGSTVVAAAASPAGAELASLEKPYFASPEQTAINRRALAAVPHGASVIAQDHFLPHLAMREQVWLPEERFLAAADYVVLDPSQSPWPRDLSHVSRFVTALRADPAFAVVFHERETMVFAKRKSE